MESVQQKLFELGYPVQEVKAQPKKRQPFTKRKGLMQRFVAGLEVRIGRDAIMRLEEDKKRGKRLFRPEVHKGFEEVKWYFAENLVKPESFTDKSTLSRTISNLSGKSRHHMITDLCALGLLETKSVAESNGK